VLGSSSRRRSRVGFAWSTEFCSRWARTARRRTRAGASGVWLAVGVARMPCAGRSLPWFDKAALVHERRWVREAPPEERGSNR
jgi:hypothetical protein